MGNEYPTQQEVQEVLREAEGLINGIDDQTTDSFTDQTETGSAVYGRSVRHGSHEYRVLASPEWRHVKLTIDFDVAASLAANRAIARTDGGHRSGAQVQLGPDDVEQAREDLADRLDEEELEEVRQGLFDRLGDGYVATGAMKANDSAVFGYGLEDRLYLYDEEVKVSEFHDRVQTLINHFWRAREFLLISYEVRHILDEDEDASDTRGYY